MDNKPLTFEDVLRTVAIYCAQLGRHALSLRIDLDRDGRIEHPISGNLLPAPAREEQHREKPRREDTKS